MILVQFLITHPSITDEHLSSVRSVTSGAAPLGAIDEQRFLERFRKPIQILQGGLLNIVYTVSFILLL
jgi:4-coumarate--CoA ligase